MSDAGALDAAAIGAGQDCPLCSIQIEFHSVHFVVIHKQHDFIGDHIIPGSPAGQCPVLVSSLGSDAAGQETIAVGSYSLQGGSGQQGLVPVQLHLYAGLKVNILQINRHSVLQVAASLSDADALDAAAIGAGQDCPLIGIKREFHSVHFVVIHKQHDFIGDDIIPGSPGGQ